MTEEFGEILIKTARLDLRQPHTAHGPALAEAVRETWHQLDNYLLTANGPDLRKEDNATFFCERQYKSNIDGNGLALHAYAGDRFIGVFEIKKTETGEWFRYGWVRQNEQQKGYGREGAKAIADHAEETLGLALSSYPAVENLAAHAMVRVPPKKQSAKS